jgi:HEAT repeat protein
VSSAAFERFKFKFLDEDTDSAREGLDEPNLASLQGDERLLAEDLLLAHLPETRAVIGLGVLRTRRAEPRLVALFESERASLSWKLIALAQALWRIQPNRVWLDAEIDALQHAGSEERREGACKALAAFHDPEAVRALVGALDAPEKIIRHHAARGLLVIHGQPVDSFDPKLAMYRVMSPDPDKREAAKAELLATIAALPMAPEG